MISVRRLRIVLLLAFVGWGGFVAAAQEMSFPEAMNSVLARLYAERTPEQLKQIDQESAYGSLNDGERAAFARQYWLFDANVPVVVSVMRHVEQKVVPFWLPEGGWQKTDLKVRNEEYEYEVWQKSFGAGRVGLGINGFEKHRPHYFVSVGPQQAGAKVELSGFYPENQVQFEMREGSTIYHDWPELVLTEVPESLRGQVLLPTIRGRARDGQLIEAFRETPLPSSERPDQIALTWSDDPRTTQTIQWRTAPSVTEGTVRYRKDGTEEWREVAAARTEIHDEFLTNDRVVSHFTATLRDLEPATTYSYTIGSGGNESTFKTAPQDNTSPFTFLFMTDTHNKPDTENLLADAIVRYPEAAFCTISGDLVGTGQYREDWDQHFDYTAGFARTKPIMPALGNHDSIDGLGAEFYLANFALPANGPDTVPKETAYSFEYGNALFVILNALDPPDAQAPWLEKQLAETKATWKFAIFHFPPYAPDDDYPDIRKHWGSLFDKYHVDFVLSGHVHYYQRTYPLKAGQRVDSPTEGTIYLITCSVPWKVREAKPDYAEVWGGSEGAPMYHAFTVDGGRLTARAHDATGKTCDELTIRK